MKAIMEITLTQRSIREMRKETGRPLHVAQVVNVSALVMNENPHLQQEDTDLALHLHPDHAIHLLLLRDIHEENPQADIANDLVPDLHLMEDVVPLLDTMIEDMIVVMGDEIETRERVCWFVDSKECQSIRMR